VSAHGSKKKLRAVKQLFLIIGQDQQQLENMPTYQREKFENEMKLASQLEQEEQIR
jgi:hypothetical protein